MTASPSRSRTSPNYVWSIGGYVAFALVVSAQIATPLVASAQEALTTAVVVTLAFATFFFARSSASLKEIVSIFLSIVLLGVGVEALGVRTGVPFGEYHYTSLLQPQIFDVPLVVAMAWFAMGIPSWEVSRRLVRRGPMQWILGGALLTAWDVMLDPQMVQNGYWEWAHEGFWQDIPNSNYLGWLLVGTLICAACSLVFERNNAAPDNPRLTLVYLWMGTFTALGFVLPFVFDRPLVGVVGGVLMIVPAIIALRSYAALGRETLWPRS